MAMQNANKIVRRHQLNLSQLQAFAHRGTRSSLMCSLHFDSSLAFRAKRGNPRSRVDADRLPPGTLVAGLVQAAGVVVVMEVAQWHAQLVRAPLA